MPNDLRMPSLNQLIIAGHLCADPDLKYTSSGTAYCKLRLANTRHYKTKGGEKKEETIFIDATLWNKPAELVGESMKKGHAVIVYGSLKQDTWEDKDSGKNRSRIEINAHRVEPLEWHGYKPGGGERPAETPAPRVIEEPIPEDEIPF